MLPEHINYPHFVPDQLLTSEHLNQLFNYVEEQERLTRTNLIGVGIVCGLQVSINPAGTEITITKGCGVTSAGYLVVFEDSLGAQEITYSRFKIFNPVQDKIYDKFVDAELNERFNLDELKRASVEDAVPFPAGYFNDKVVLLYVELLEEGAKNCNPNSCDDKGVTVTVTIRPLVVHKDQAPALLATQNVSKNYSSLPWLKLRRFDVLNHEPVTSEDIFDAYKIILNASFVTAVESALTDSYNLFSYAVSEEIPANPFQGLAADYAFLNDGSAGSYNLVHIQYYYDFFSDILQAYDEFREAAIELSSKCCIDGSLFPRHLLLGETYDSPGSKPEFRHYFISSPLFSQKHLFEKLQSLFRRLVKIKNEFFLPDSYIPGNSTVDSTIRITPSLLSNAPISEKAIPYYYRIKTDPNPLYKLWSYEKTSKGDEATNLSYHASEYTSDNFTVEPLKYDLEPYNFFRIEGHIGKPYVHALTNIKRIIYNYRIPVHVIALRTGNIEQGTAISPEHECVLLDIELSYDIARRDWEAVIGKTIEYLNLNLNAISQEFGTVIYQSVVSFIKQLQLAKTYMVSSVSVFVSNYYSFINLYEEIEKNAENLRSAILKSGFGRTPVLREDLVDHIDDVLLSCKKGPFRALYQEYSRRITDIYANLYLGPYLEKHPGIQHKAGVSTGGTFIIVYHSSGGRREKANYDRIPLRGVNEYLTGNVRFANGNAAVGATIRLRGASRTVTTDSAGSFTIYANFLPSTLTVSVYGQRDKEILVNDNRDISDIIIGDEDQFDDEENISQLQEGIVIADFYLPYSFNSNCTPIQYIINEAKNQPPLARAGEDVVVTLPGNKVAVDGTNSSDPDGTIQTYTWAYKSGPATFKIEDPSAAKTTIADLVEGEYVFTLTVTDNDGLVSVDEVKIAIQPAPNIPPVARAGEDQGITLPENTTTLDGSASTDADGTINAYKWILISGPTGAFLATPDAAVTQIAKLVEGSYVCELTVTDDKGATGKDTVIITVQALPNQPPVAHAGEDITITSPENSATLDGSKSSDPDGEIVNYRWKQISGPMPGSLVNGEQVITGVGKLAETGQYVFELTVVDDKGATDTDTVVIIVQEPQNQLPVANAGEDRTVTLPVRLLTLNGSASFDPDGIITSFKWAQISGPADIKIGTTDAAITSLFKLTPGEFVFELTVTDDKGATASDTVTVTIQEREQPQKVCSPLDGIISEFKKLPEIQPTLFPVFVGIFQSYPKVEEFFTALENMFTKPVEEQIAFFEQAEVEKLLAEWFDQLFPLILQSDLREHALALYRILISLSEYIACIQKEDIDKASVRLNGVFQIVLKQMSVIMRSSPNFPQELLARLIQILNDLAEEEQRIQNNGEQTSKPIYFRIIQMLIEMLKPLNR